MCVKMAFNCTVVDLHGIANLAISEATALLMSDLQSAMLTLSSSFKITKATVVSPLISCATEITAASDVAG